MSSAGLIVAVFMLTTCVLLVVWPLLRRGSDPTAESARRNKQRERLLAYYERVLTNIRDLDEDHATGKMPDDDYTAEREEWVQRGIHVLRALDEVSDHSLIADDTADEAAVDEAIDHAIEAAIAARRQQPQP